MVKTSKKQKLPLAAKAYQIIHEKIVSLDITPGHLLDEKQLSIQLGIGRTPIREAFLRLASESLVETKPNKGFIVSPLTIQNTKAMFEALYILEMGVASLAVLQDPTSHLLLMQEAHQAVRMAIDSSDILGLVWSNDHFHMYFAHCSGNDYIARALRNVRNELNRLAYLSYGGKNSMSEDLSGHYQFVCREHEQIIEYLKKRDLDRLKETIEKHIRTFQQRVILYLTNSMVKG